LLPLLEENGDLGLHLVIARRLDSVDRAVDPVLERLRELGSAGIQLSGRDTPESRLFSRPVPRPSLLPAGRGWLTSARSPAQLIQIGWLPPEETPEASSAR
jgi:S-DNA-T family DNA segregation ATPase FtsK/SpoIIIE